MERCALCRRTIKEIAEEELKQRLNLDGGIDIKFDENIAYPYKVCNECSEFLKIVIPTVMAQEKE